MQNKDRMLRSFSSKGMKGFVQKLLAAGAKTETTDEVHGRRGWWAGDVWWERLLCEEPPTEVGAGWVEDAMCVW